MNKIFCNKIIFVIWVFINFSALSIERVPDELLNDAGEETVQLATKYNEFCDEYNNESSFKLVINSYQKFEDVIFYGVSDSILTVTIEPIDQNKKSLLSFLRCSKEILKNIKQEIDETNPDIISNFIQEKTIPILENRIDLARLDLNVLSNFGSVGSIDIKINFPADLKISSHKDKIIKRLKINKKTIIKKNLQKTLKLITGRLFHIGIEDDDLISTSSATMISWDCTNHTIQNLDLFRYSILNSILTCAHALKSDEGRSDFYFVQSKNIDLRNGFPLGVDTSENLIGFLKNDEKSFKINSFSIKNRYSNIFKKIDLEMGQPQYFSKEDMLIGHIQLNTNNDKQKLPFYNALSKVFFDKYLTSKGNQDYFALGYPGCNHYKILSRTLLLESSSLSPIFLTHSKNSGKKTIRFKKNGTFTHYAPAASGMSGGPLFYLNLDKNSINIFGVITRGGSLDEEEEGCHWF